MDKRFPLEDQIEMLGSMLRGRVVAPADADYEAMRLVALSQFLPFVVLILPAGHVADRYDRRRVQLLTYVLLAVCAAALLVLALIDVNETGPVFAVMVVYGIARAFNHPTGQALLPNLAPIALFPRAIAVHSSLGQVATIAGPALGGTLILLGVGAAYAVSLVLVVSGVALVAGLRGGGREEPSREPVSWSTPTRSKGSARPSSRTAQRPWGRTSPR